MNFDVPAVLCTICYDTKRGSVFELDCQHMYHKSCLRKYFRTLRCGQPDALLPCPCCRIPASDAHAEILLNERRCLSYRYTCPKNAMMNPNLSVRVVISVGYSDEVLMRGNVIRVCDMMEDPDDPERRFLIEDFEVVVQDPHTKFSVWVENAENETRISQKQILETMSLGDDTEEEEQVKEGEVPLILSLIPPSSSPEPQNVSVVRRQTETITTSSTPLQQDVGPMRQYRKRYSKLLQAQQRVRRAEISLRQAQENAHRALRLVDDVLTQMFPY